MPYSATRLRQNLYAILDSVLESGYPEELVSLNWSGSWYLE